MSEGYGFESIKSGNLQDYAAYLEGTSGGETAGALLSIGITKDARPCGALVLRKERGLLSVMDISADFQKEEEARSVYQEIFRALSRFAVQQGYQRIACRYTDDEPGISEEVLKRAGFSDFQEETVVYRISAWMLGLLLRDGPESRSMRANSVRILDAEKTRRFSEADQELKDLLSELYPREALSFLTIGENRTLESYVTVSALPDGALYLSDLHCAPGCERDLSGLLYLSLGAAFLEIEPDGEFYVAAVNKRLENLTEHILAPVREGVDRQKIYRAGKSMV